MRDIVIRKIEKKNVINPEGNPRVRLSCFVQIVVADKVQKEEELWFETETKFEKYLSDDRCDGLVVMILLTAMLERTSHIRSEYPISEKLWYNLTYHVIPQIVVMDKRRLKKIVLDMPLTKEVYDSKEVGVGMSRGIDSFATFYEYCDFPIEEYKLTSLTYYNVGAHHGQGIKDRTMRERFLGQLVGTEKFCKDYNYPLLTVDSNLYDFLRSITQKRVGFDRTHTYRNLGCTLLFQRYFKKYYYSSAYNLDGFKANIYDDCAHYEKWLIPLLGTENTTFYNSNQEWNRIDKTRMIAEKEGCYKHLLVCFSEDKNCGKCAKCKRTLMQIDSLGGDFIDNFKHSFNIEKYRNEYREKWFNQIDDLMINGMVSSIFFQETFYEALRNRPELVCNSIHVTMYNPPATFKVRAKTLAVRRNPKLESELLTRIPENYVFECTMECDGWCKIVLEDGTIGWSSKKYLSMIKNESEN